MKSNVSYGLRANPKKSLRVSDSNSGITSSPRLSQFACRVCGKAFPKSRQLCGHLRHHSNSERQDGRHKCKECGKRFKSIRALCGHMKSHRDGVIRAEEADCVTDCALLLVRNVGVCKRARTPRFEVFKRTVFDFHSDNLKSVEECEDQSELDEVAASLILLSQGLEFSGNVYANGEGVKMGIGSCEKLEMELASCKSLDMYGNVEVDVSVKDEGFAGQFEMGGVCAPRSELVKAEDDGICSVSRSVLKYKCVSCDKEFSSHQALGGHRSSKHRWSRCLKTDICRSTEPFAIDDVQQKDEISVVGIPHFELHKCPLRLKIFRSAQALGSHLGAHVVESSETDQVQQPGGCMQGTAAAEGSMISISQSPLAYRKMVVS